MPKHLVTIVLEMIMQGGWGLVFETPATPKIKTSRKTMSNRLGLVPTVILEHALVK